MTNGPYLIKLITLIIIFMLITGEVIGQSKILINEFLIDPQPQQVELYNSGTETIDISGWRIDDSGGTTFYTIPQNNILSPNSCFLFSGDFNLNKTSADTIRLINNDLATVDSYSYKSSSGEGISFYRLADGENDWTTGSATLGFYNSSKLSCIATPILTPTETPTPSITIGPTTSSQLYDNIFIFEVMVNPSSENNEWVEIYNNNDFSVSLTNWQIDDRENSGSSPKTFSLEIPAKNYRSFSLTSAMFNNDGDSVRLLNYNNTLADSFEYKSSAQGKTWGRINFQSDEFCLQEPSYESANNSCLNPTSDLTLTLLPTKTNSITLDSSPIKPISPMFKNVNHPINPINREVKKGEILGIETNTSSNKLLTKFLSFVSLSYSLLTIISILFKMKFIYGKGEKFLSSFIYTGGAQ